MSEDWRDRDSYDFETSRRRPVRKIFTLLLGIAVCYTAIRSIPDIVRYIKISRM